jgi:WD40 repeat protein
LWNAADGALVRTLHGGRKPLVGLQFSPDGQRIAAGSWDFCAFIWEVSGGEPRTFPIPDEGVYNAVDSVAWSQDGALLAAASRDRTARLWQVESGELIATLRGHADEVRRVAFAPHAPLLATAAADGTVKMWSSVDGALRATLQGHAAAVADLRFAPHGRLLYSAGKDDTVRAWEANPSVYGGARAQSGSAPYVARWSPDERRIAVASYDGRISLFDGESLDPLTSWQAHPQSCHALGWTADGKALVSGSWESVLRIWDAEQGTELAAFEQGEGTTDLAVSPDGRFAASCAGAKVCVYDLEQRLLLHVFTGHRASALAVNFSPDSLRCISTGRDGRALVWDTASGAMIHDILVPDPDVADAAFTPDGRHLVIAGRTSGIVLLHDAASGARLRELAHLRHGIQHLDVSPDGARAVLASDSLVLVDLTNGRDVGHLRPHLDNPYNVDFDARGGRLLSCSTDGSIVVLDTRPLRERLRPSLNPR